VLACQESNLLAEAIVAKDRPETGAAQSAVAAVSCNCVSCVCSSISWPEGSTVDVDVEDDSSFDDAGDGIPRSGAVPKSTAGAVLKLFTVVLMHGKGGEEIEEQADGMKRTSYAIDQKRGPSYAS
jgi:hypothetical protein